MLTDDELLHAYQQAVELQLDHHFIQLLQEEINRRQLEMHNLVWVSGAARA